MREIKHCTPFPESTNVTIQKYQTKELNNRGFISLLRAYYLLCKDMEINERY